LSLPNKPSLIRCIFPPRRLLHCDTASCFVYRTMVDLISLVAALQGSGEFRRKNGQKLDLSPRRWRTYRVQSAL
jgi:hypothetical protein